MNIDDYLIQIQHAKNADAKREAIQKTVSAFVSRRDRKSLDTLRNWMIQEVVLGERSREGSPQDLATIENGYFELQKAEEADRRLQK